VTRLAKGTTSVNEMRKRKRNRTTDEDRIRWAYLERKAQISFTHEPTGGESSTYSNEKDRKKEEGKGSPYSRRAIIYYKGKDEKLKRVGSNT